jgi:hypothetical protein
MSVFGDTQPTALGLLPLTQGAAGVVQALESPASAAFSAAVSDRIVNGR